MTLTSCGGKTKQVNWYSAFHIDILVLSSMLMFNTCDILQALSLFCSKMMKLLLAVASVQMFLAPVFMVSAVTYQK